MKMKMKLDRNLHFQGLFHPAFFARALSHENGDKQRPTKRRRLQGMLDKTDPLRRVTIEIFKITKQQQVGWLPSINKFKTQETIG